MPRGHIYFQCTSKKCYCKTGLKIKKNKKVNKILKARKVKK